MFSNMNSMAISSGRESDFFKGIKSKHSEAFEFLFWHSLGKYEHLTFKTTLEFNMPLAAHVSNISMTDILSNTSFCRVFWLPWFQRSLNNAVWAISSIFHCFFNILYKKISNKTYQTVLWKKNFFVYKCANKCKAMEFYQVNQVTSINILLTSLLYLCGIGKQI